MPTVTDLQYECTTSLAECCTSKVVLKKLFHTCVEMLLPSFLGLL